MGNNNSQFLVVEDPSTMNDNVLEVNVNLSTALENAEASHTCTTTNQSKNPNTNSEPCTRNILYYDDNKNNHLTNTSNEQKRSKEELACSPIIWLHRQKREDEEKRDVCDGTTSPPQSNTTKGKSFSYSFHACAKYNDYDNEDDETTATIMKSSSLFFQKSDYTEDEMLMEDGDVPLEESDLRPRIVECEKRMKKIQCRSFHIVTTAALPWMTGTAVNPLLRAAYLNKMNRDAVKNFLSSNNESYGKQPLNQNEKLMGSVTLCIPWLVDEADRQIVYGEKFSFHSPKDQEKYIRDWLSESAKLPLEASLDTNGIKILFYEAGHSKELLSIFPVADIRESIDLDAEDADVCILEEPEHLNITLPSSCDPWRKTFRHVIGIMHTNYLAYSQNANVSGLALVPFQAVLNAWMSRVHCDKIIKLSDTLQTYAVEKECVNNVHGIRSDFLEEGKRRASAYSSASTGTTESSPKNKIYFVGKLLWAKGLDRLIGLQSAFKRSTGNYFEIDIIGSGPEKEEIQRAFHGRSKLIKSKQKEKQEEEQKSQKVKPFSSHHSFSELMNEMPKSRHEFRKESIPATFPGRMDHASLKEDYKIFVNPSLTEVLCTTTAEAIAMGKFAIIPKHCSNTFFEQFPNCLTYKKNEEFVAHLQYAMNNEPVPLSQEHSHILTWNAATERCIEASKITKRDFRRRIRLRQTELDERALEKLRGPIFVPFHRYTLDSMGLAPAAKETAQEGNDRVKDISRIAVPVE